MQLATPIVVPPKPEVVADKMLASQIVIERNPVDGTYAATAKLQFYSEAEDGTKTFAIDDNGQRIEAYLTTPNVEVTGAAVPSLLIAFGALEQAISDFYAYRQTPPPSASDQTPLPSDTPPADQPPVDPVTV